MVRKGQFVGLDWNRSARLRSQIMTGTCELTSSIALLRHLSHKDSLTVAQWLEHLTTEITEGRGFKSVLGLGFFQVCVSSCEAIY